MNKPFDEPPPGETPTAETAGPATVQPAPTRARSVPDRLWLKIPLVLFILALPVAAFAWMRCGVSGCPDVDRLGAMTADGAPVLLTRDGEKFGELELATHVTVPLDEMPEFVPEAFIAVEDRRFLKHGGVDYRRVGGALLANVKAGGAAQGSSTLTMQLARNIFPDRIPGQDKTIGRKLLEVRVAKDIEKEYGKQEILELYLNHIYFGGGARGIEAASEQYFGHGARELSLQEAAVLAALPKAPTHYDPRRHPERAKERRNLVLDLMEQQGRLDTATAEAARQTELEVKKKGRPEGKEVPFAAYFVQQVQRDIEELFGDDLYRRPVEVVTTLDMNAQKAAEEELRRQLQRVENGAYGTFKGAPYKPGADVPDEGTQYLQGAMVVLEAATGDVLAWVGGRDYRDSTFDRVTRAKRQVGSAFKPFVLATAVEQGYPLSTLLEDQPLEIQIDRNTTWKPKNFENRYDGAVTLREAMVSSKNVATVRLIEQVGVTNVRHTAERAGLPDDLPKVPSLALGVATLSPLDITSSYTVFADQGTRVAPRTIREVRDPETGELLWSAQRETSRVLDPQVAYLVTSVLADVVDRGTGNAVRQAGYRGPAAGKTGTTNEGLDTWFVGYTPEVVAGVWIGFDQPAPIVGRASGGKLAAPVWGRVMRRVYQNRKGSEGWPRPGGLMKANVDKESGFPIAEGCNPGPYGAYSEIFLAGRVPRRVCPGRDSQIADDLRWQPYDADYDYETDTSLYPEGIDPELVADAYDAAAAPDGSSPGASDEPLDVERDPETGRIEISQSGQPRQDTEPVVEGRPTEPRPQPQPQPQPTPQPPPRQQPPPQQPQPQQPPPTQQEPPPDLPEVDVQIPEGPPPAEPSEPPPVGAAGVGF